MPDVRGLFPSNWIKAPDLQGKRVLLRMSHVSVEEVGDDKKPVLYFTGTKKGLVLNVTNANMIAEITGTNETEDWRGKQIALFVTKVEYGGKRVDGIRVDYPNAAAPPAPRRAAPSVAAPMTPVSELADAFEEGLPEGAHEDDGIPFAWLLPLILPMVGIMGAGLFV